MGQVFTNVWHLSREFKVASCNYLTHALDSELVFKLKLLFIAYNENIDA